VTGAAAPIGVFDSGVGGLTVARAIMDQLPAESIRYLGDTANGPYGPQPIADVRAHALAAMDQLVESGVKLLVVACNSASAACLHDARERYDVPVIEVILPAVRRAIAATRSGKIGVIGTQTTVGSRAYDDAFAAAPQVSISSAACPSFVDFVERGITSGRQILGLAQSYLEPLQRAEVDTLVLGCTHYPLLTGAISHVMGDGVTLVSSAEETAKDVFRVLTDEDLLRDGADTAGEEVSPGEHRFFSTGDAESFHRLAERFLGPAVGPIATLPVVQTAKAGDDTEARVPTDAAAPPDTTPDGTAVAVPAQYSADSIPVPNAAAQ
jgi:glutamate racemase